MCVCFFVGAKFAIDMVNQDSSVLPTHELDLIVNDTRCRADVALNNFIKLMLMQDHSFKILGILGMVIFYMVIDMLQFVTDSFYYYYRKSTARAMMKPSSKFTLLLCACLHCFYGKEMVQKGSKKTSRIKEIPWQKQKDSQTADGYFYTLLQ